MVDNKKRYEGHGRKDRWKGTFDRPSNMDYVSRKTRGVDRRFKRRA